MSQRRHERDPFEPVLPAALLSKIRQRQSQDKHRRAQSVSLPRIRSAGKTDVVDDQRKLLSTADARQLIHAQLQSKSAQKLRKRKLKTLRTKRAQQVTAMKVRALKDHDKKFAGGSHDGNQTRSKNRRRRARSMDYSRTQTTASEPEMQFILFRDVHPHHVQSGLRILHMPSTKYLQSVHTTFHMCQAMVTAIDHSIEHSRRLVDEFCRNYMVDTSEDIVIPDSVPVDDNGPEGDAPVVDALLSAVREDCVDLIPFLLSGDDALLCRRNAEGHNALMVAVAHQSEKCIQYLLESDHVATLVQQSTPGGLSALMLAAANGNSDTILAILDWAKASNLSKTDMALSTLTLLQQHIDTRESLVLHADTGAFKVTDDQTSTTLQIGVNALVLMVLDNNVAGIERLLELFFVALDTVMDDFGSLQETDAAPPSSKDEQEAVSDDGSATEPKARSAPLTKKPSRRFLSVSDDGGLQSRRGIMPLCFAVMQQNRPVVRLLLDAMKRLPARRRLWSLGEQLNDELSGRNLESVICGDINEEALKNSGVRVLHLATYLQDPQMVEDLLQAGADPNLVAKFSIHSIPGQHFSPFESVSLRDHHPMDIQDVTALDVAVLTGNFFSTRALLQHGAFVDHCDTMSGNTPAMLAGAMRDFDILGLLLDFGASRVRQNNEGMVLEAILQQLHQVTVEAAAAEGMTQRIQLLADQPKLQRFWSEAMAYLTMHRQDPEAPPPDIYDPVNYPFHPNAHNAMPLLNWDVVFELGVKAQLWKSPLAKGFVDHSKAAAFAERIARTSWVLSPVTSSTPEHAVVDALRYRRNMSTTAVSLSELRAAAARSTSPTQQDCSPSESPARSRRDPPLKYAFEVEIGVAVALENADHGSRLKCGTPNIASVLNGRTNLQNATTTLLEFMAVYHQQRRAAPKAHFRVPSSGHAVMPPVRFTDCLKVASSGKDVLQQASFARHAADLVHHQLRKRHSGRALGLSRIRHSSATRVRPASGRPTPASISAGPGGSRDSVLSGHYLEASEEESEIVHPLAPQRLRLTVLLDVWARVEREFMAFPSGVGGALDLKSATIVSRPLVADQAVYESSCVGYMDKLLPTINRLRAVDAVAGTAMLQQFAFIGATLRAGVEQCKVAYLATSTVYQLRQYWVENSAELQATAYSSLTGKSRDTAAESLSVTNISQVASLATARQRAKAARARIEMSRQLLAACMLNDLNRAKKILQFVTRRGSSESANININAASELSGYCSPLLVATIHSNVALMKLLLSHGANIDFVATRRAALLSRKVHTHNPFVEASQHGKALARQNSMPMAPTTTTAAAVAAASQTAVKSADSVVMEHVTALMVATLLQDVASVKALLKAHPDPRVKNAAGQNVFHIAAIVGSADVMQLLVHAYAANHSGLLAKGANQKPGDGESLEHGGASSSALQGDRRSPTVDINDIAAAQGFTPLFFAAACGHNDVVQILCDGGKELHIDLDALTVSGITPLIAACYHNSENAALTLLRAGADPNVIVRHNGGNALTGLGTDGTSGVQLALFHGDVELLRTLFKFGAHAPRDDQEIAAVCADYDMMVLMADAYTKHELGEDATVEASSPLEGRRAFLSSDDETLARSLDFRALHLVKTLHGVRSPLAVVERGISQLLLVQRKQKQILNDARSIFLYFGLDPRRNKISLTVLRTWLQELEFDKFYGSEFASVTRSLFRPRLVVSKGVLREDDPEQGDDIPEDATFNDYIMIDELARRRKLHEEEAALPFTSFLKLYSTLDRLLDVGSKEADRDRSADVAQSD